ncbi:hypothetical protein BN2476_330039 [Paraburkholderia piptadeniae]|uniref:Uncharacterized protein n=1 Tax=Paraburkholderia piptadeniae TaxID=1701573 RepID=A0A1N7S6G4_9BURK|nr:hypothetical protein BN2476_330039 [Paraburkholderia piptadeniae]
MFSLHSPFELIFVRQTDQLPAVNQSNGSLRAILNMGDGNLPGDEVFPVFMRLETDSMRAAHA